MDQEVKRISNSIMRHMMDENMKEPHRQSDYSKYIFVRSNGDVLYDDRIVDAEVFDYLLTTDSICYMEESLHQSEKMHKYGLN